MEWNGYKGATVPLEISEKIKNPLSEFHIR
jgi:hypothetical protein